MPSASVSNVDKLSQSEYANLKPIEKALNKLKITCKNAPRWREAHGRYCSLIKRDDNFEMRFPDKVFTFFQAILDIFFFPFSKRCKLNHFNSLLIYAYFSSFIAIDVLSSYCSTENCKFS